MGHLGNSTPITTVQDKEIVLTGSDGHTFKMKVTDLAEAVRQVMPVATKEQNGLLGVQQLIEIINSLKGAGVLEGGLVDGIRNTGIYSVTSVIPSSGNLWGILVVFNSGYYILQLIFGASGAGFRYAHGQKNEWSSWVTL